MFLLFSCGNGVSKVQTKKLLSDTISYSYKKDGILYLDLKTAKEKKVDINLSDICDSVIYIPLETKKNCLLTHINQIEIDSKNIFIYSGWSFFRFDISGKFLNQYGKTGRGPGEYICQGFCLDKRNKIVYPSTIFRNKRYKFTYDGKFLKSFPLQDNRNTTRRIYYNYRNNTFINSTEYEIFSRKDDANNGKRILVSEVNEQGKYEKIIYSKFFTPENFYIERYCGLFYPILSNMYIYDDTRIMLSEVVNDTLFEYKNNKIYPKVITNNKAFRNKLKIEMFSNIKTIKSYGKVHNIIRPNTYSTVVNESRRYMFLTSLDGLMYIYDKIDDKLRCVNINYNIDGLDVINFYKIINNKYFYGLINADEFIKLAEESLKSSKYPDRYKSKLKSVLGKINEESNSILILYKIKN